MDPEKKKGGNIILKIMFFACFAGIVVFLFSNKGNLYAVLTGLGLFMALIAFTVMMSIKGAKKIMVGLFVAAGFFVALLGYGSLRGLALPNGRRPVEILLCFVMIFPFLGIYGFLTYLKELSGLLGRCRTETKAEVLSSGFRFDRSADRFIEAHRGAGVFMTLYSFSYNGKMYKRALPSFTPSREGGRMTVHLNADDPEEFYSSKYLVYVAGSVAAYVLMFIAGVLASRFIFDYLGFALLK